MAHVNYFSEYVAVPTPTTSLWRCLQVNAHLREKQSVTFILKQRQNVNFSLHLSHSFGAKEILSRALGCRFCMKMQKSNEVVVNTNSRWDLEEHDTCHSEIASSTDIWLNLSAAAWKRLSFPAIKRKKLGIKMNEMWQKHARRFDCKMQGMIY